MPISRLLNWAVWAILAGLALIMLLAIAMILWIKASFNPTPPAYIAKEPAPADKPNILLLVAEDLSPRIGAFGDQVANTPNLDRLASEGVRYTNVFTTAGVCAPSRAAIITGMHQSSIGAQHMRTSNFPGGAYKTVPPPYVKAFPELLRREDYYTYTDIKLDYQFSGPMAHSGPFTIWDDEGAKAHWRNRGDNQLFFGYHTFMITHESGFLKPFRPWPRNRQELLFHLMRLATGEPSVDKPTSSNDINPPPYLPDTPVIRSEIAKYYDRISTMDAQVGEVLRLLEQDGLADSTIVIWTTDHGDGLPGAKRHLFDRGIHVPMIIRWPARFRPDGVEPGSIETRLISFVDLAPTILHLAGAPVPRHLQGRDFVSGEPRNFVFASRDRMDEFEDRERAVRSGRYKYIRSWYPQSPTMHLLPYRDSLLITRELRRARGAGLLDAVQKQLFEPTGEERLFDVNADPYEVHNLIGDNAHQDVLEEMRAALQDWMNRVGDMGDIPESEMVASFLDANGKQRVTPAPSISLSNDAIILSTPVDGASIGYRFDNRLWRIYDHPVPIRKNATLEAKAVRYGWKESKIVKKRM